MTNLIAVEREANALLRKHGLADQGWTFRWDSAKSRGGECNYVKKTISMSRLLVPGWSSQEITDTLLHEVGHALVGPGHGHSSVWVRKVLSIGGSASVTHNAPTVQRQWAAMCSKHGVVGYRHRRRKNLICALCRTKIVWKMREPETIN